MTHLDLETTGHVVLADSNAGIAASSAEFATLLDAWAAAIVANDAEAIDTFMTPEWVIVGQDGITTR